MTDFPPRTLIFPVRIKRIKVIDDTRGSNEMSRGSRIFERNRNVGQTL